MNPIKTLWAFSRPHTLIGSTLSISALYALSVWTVDGGGAFLSLFLPSLVVALATNIYITGLNQYTDVEVDRINKPWLPIPAGQLSMRQAFWIVLACGALALVVAPLFSWAFLLLIVAIMALGTAYSLPPLKFKRSHVLAAFAITAVRGVLVNVGFFLHFTRELTGSYGDLSVIWPLVAFVVAFSFGIAWFKDLPDTEGDAVFQFGTLALTIGRRGALLAGTVAVGVGYLAVAAAAALGSLPEAPFFLATHLALLALFLVQALRLPVDDDRKVKRFYLFIWGLFFVEYLLYPAGFWIAGMGG